MTDKRDNTPSEITLVLNDGIYKTSYPIPPDTIIEIQVDPDTGDGFAILDDGTEMEITRNLIELVTRHFPEVRITERFNFMRWLERL